MDCPSHQQPSSKDQEPAQLPLLQLASAAGRFHYDLQSNPEIGKGKEGGEKEGQGGREKAKESIGIGTREKGGTIQYMNSFLSWH